MRILSLTQVSINVVNGRWQDALDYNLVQDAARGVIMGLVGSQHQEDAQDALMEVLHPPPGDGQQVILSHPIITRTTIGGLVTIITHGGTHTLLIDIGMVDVLELDRVLINHNI